MYEIWHKSCLQLIISFHFVIVWSLTIVELIPINISIGYTNKLPINLYSIISSHKYTASFWLMLTFYFFFCKKYRRSLQYLEELNQSKCILWMKYSTISCLIFILPLKALSSIHLNLQFSTIFNSYWRCFLPLIRHLCCILKNQIHSKDHCEYAHLYWCSILIRNTLTSLLANNYKNNKKYTRIQYF